MKKGRHRRFEEARALKRSDNVDLDGIFESLDDNDSSGVSDWEDVADEYSQWADVAAEYEAKQAADTTSPDAGASAADEGDAPESTLSESTVSESTVSESTVSESTAPEAESA